jgi:hypothetical protein
MTLPADTAVLARKIVESIAAVPRFAGSDSERVAREFCRDRLQVLGFETSEEEFSYSEFPARFGPFICGVVLIAGAFLAGHLATVHLRAGAGILVAAVAMAGSILLGRFFIMSVLSFPAMRRTSANLVATRGNNPTVWLVAHTDSKSQTIGMLLRIGSFAFGSGLYALLILLMLRLYFGFPVTTDNQEDVQRAAIVMATIVTTLAFIPFALCFITNKSQGALDNASGVAAVLLAAELAAPGKNFGVLLTSGEELALAGAKAFVAAHEREGIAINCDTIDNSGRFIGMKSGRWGECADALVKAGQQTGEKLRIRGTIAGILTDSVAFAAAGWDTCTLSRGNLATLARVHTSGDKPDRIDGTGIALAARILAATLEELS